jgi:hypothetical protein
VAPAFSDHQIAQYVAFGFIPELGDEDPLHLLGDWSRQPRRASREASASSLVREGTRALRAAFEECAALSDGRADQAVFLSGGLDSRTILGAALEQFHTSEVVAATFGLPGEQDFEFAAIVAQAAGVRHEVLESFSVDWTTSGLVDSVLARELPLPFPFGQRYLSYVLHTRIGRDAVFWDGLCGDAVSGDWAPRVGEHWSWPRSVQRFLRVHVLAGHERYVRPGFRADDVMPVAPFCAEGILSYPDQLDFAIRQTKYTGTRRLRDYTIRTPFLRRPWLDFMFGLPVQDRQQQHLYMEIQRQAFPRLFALPTTTFHGAALTASRLSKVARRITRRPLLGAANRGLPLTGRGGMTSGANAAIRRSYRDRGELRVLVQENLSDLAARGVLEHAGSGRELLSPGDDGAMVSDDMISVLLGLELNLKAVDRLQAMPQPSEAETS